MLPVENEASQEKVSLECKAIKKLHLLIEVKRGEKPLQSHATLSICEGRILASDTEHGVMKSSARGKRLFTLSPRRRAVDIFQQRVGAADFPFHFAASHGTHFLRCGAQITTTAPPMQVQKKWAMGWGIALGASRISRRAGLFSFPSGIELLSVRCRCPGVNYLQRVGSFKTALLSARELIPRLITNEGEPLWGEKFVGLSNQWI